MSLFVGVTAPVFYIHNFCSSIKPWMAAFCWDPIAFDSGSPTELVIGVWNFSHHTTHFSTEQISNLSTIIQKAYQITQSSHVGILIPYLMFYRSLWIILGQSEWLGEQLLYFYKLTQNSPWEHILSLRYDFFFFFPPQISVFCIDVHVCVSEYVCGSVYCLHRGQKRVLELE